MLLISISDSDNSDDDFSTCNTLIRTAIKSSYLSKRAAIFKGALRGSSFPTFRIAFDDLAHNPLNYFFERTMNTNLNDFEMLCAWICNERVALMETAPPTKLKPAEKIIDIGLLPYNVRRGTYTFTFESSLPVWDSLLATANADKIVKTPNLFDSDGIPRNNVTLIWSTAAAAGRTLGFSADILNRIAYHSADISDIDDLIVSGSLVTDAAGNLRYPGLLFQRSWNGYYPACSGGTHTGRAQKTDAATVPTLSFPTESVCAIQFAKRKWLHMDQDPNASDNA